MSKILSSKITKPSGRRRSFESTATRLLLVLWAACLCGVSETASRADVIAPGTPIDGRTQLRQAELWWQTMFNISAANNPILDETGADALRAQVGPVLYLAGSFNSSSERSITIGPGTTLFFPLLNSYVDNTGFIDPDATSPPFSEPFTDSAEDLLASIAIPPGSVENLILEIDGVSVRTTAELLDHRQTTDPNDPFTNVIFSPENLFVDFGLDPTLGTGDPFDPASYPASIFPAVLDGYWVGLTPFAPGDYTLRFGGSVDDPVSGQFSQDNLFRIRVVPEPTSVLLLGLGIASAGLIQATRKT